MTKELALAATLVGLFATAPVAEAIPSLPSGIIPTIPYEVIEPIQGLSVAGPLTDAFDTALPPPATIGSLVSEVFFDGSVYTYAFTVTPSIDGFSEVATGFPVASFIGEAGYSLSDATAAGGLAFTIFLDSDGTLDYEQTAPGLAWGAGDPITFFFRSTHAPTFGDYGVIDGEVGAATGFRPVPEPSALLLLGAGLVGLGVLRRRARR